MKNHTPDQAGVNPVNHLAPAAGKIARGIGADLPSVVFFGIAAPHWIAVRNFPQFRIFQAW